MKNIYTVEGGFKALYKGIWPTILGIAPYVGLNFAVNILVLLNININILKDIRIYEKNTVTGKWSAYSIWKVF